METTYENVVEEIVQSIFSTMLNIELIRSNAPSSADQELLLAAVQIAGQWTGSVVLAMSSELAGEVAGSMMAIPPQEAREDDLHDTAAELVNMVGGNLKSLLPGPSYLSLPTVFTGGDIGMQIHNAILIEDVGLRSAVGTLRVRLYEKIAQANNDSD